MIGVDARIIFVSRPEPLAERLREARIPFHSLGLARGRHVLRHPRLLAHHVAEVGTDGALLISPGHLAAALRVGGYRKPIVAANHDSLLQLHNQPLHRRLWRRADRLSGSWASDVEVAVSDFMLAKLQEHRRARRVVRIYNGIDLGVYKPASSTGRSAFTVGWAGRLIEGKGIDILIRAFASVVQRIDGLLRIAGEGAERGPLTELARKLGVEHAVRFEGIVPDMPSFWQQCDAAAMPSDRLLESFGMAAVEAMACAKPVVASRSGALPEIVGDGTTGRLVEPGSVESLRDALVDYAFDDERRRSHGNEARGVCETRFSIDRCASSYLALFERRTTGRGGAQL
jgi:glycosyltransferase involved in cell wall biosynthesis